jgi:hypothetical protein
MSKLSLHLNLRDIRLLRPFQVRDKADKTLFMRSRFLLLLTILALIIFAILQSHHLNLMAHRDYLETLENDFLTHFYPTYDRNYYWLSYQGNLAQALADTLANGQTAADFLVTLAPALEQNPTLLTINFGILGRAEQWSAQKTAENGWQLLDSDLSLMFSSWLMTKNYAHNQIYWEETTLNDTNVLKLFWLYQTEAGERYYFQITSDFDYQSTIAKLTELNNQGVAIFLGENNERYIFPLWETPSSPSTLSGTPLASTQAVLHEEANLEAWGRLANSDLLTSTPSNRENVFYYRLDNRDFWFKVIPFPDQVNFNHLILILQETSLLGRFGIRPWMLTILFVSIIIINFLIFIYYYLQFYHRYFFTNQIKDILKNGESGLIEFKSTLRYSLKEKALNKNLEMMVLKSIAAFNNTDGGMLFLGVDDKGRPLGLKKDYSTLKKPEKDGFELHLRALISQAYGQHFAARRIEILFPCLLREEICMVRVKKGRAPLYTVIADKNGVKSEKFYIRMGNSSHEIKNPSDIVAYQKDRFGWKLRLGKK